MTITVAPNEEIAQTRIVTPSLGLTLILDFGAVLAAGDTVASVVWTISSTSATQSSASVSGATATIVLANTLLSGQQVLISCAMTSTAGDKQGRSVRLVARDMATV